MAWPNGNGNVWGKGQKIDRWLESPFWGMAWGWKIHWNFRTWWGYLPERDDHTKEESVKNSSQWLGGSLQIPEKCS